jgi:hypothetical protein
VPDGHHQQRQRNQPRIHDRQQRRRDEGQPDPGRALHERAHGDDQTGQKDHHHVLPS